MKSIELHNFKKFEFLPEIKLGKVNFLVGKNNSGKSSFIRAIQIIDRIFKECKLVTEYEDPQSVPEDRDECFALGPACAFPLYHEETRTTTFKNYLYDKAKDDTISISLNFSEKSFDDKYYDVNVAVKFERFSMRDDRSWGKLTFLNIKDDLTGIEIEFDFKHDKEIFVFRPNDMDRKLQQFQLSEQIVEKTITMPFDSLLNEISKSSYFYIENVDEKYGLSALIKCIYSYIVYGYGYDDEKKEIKLQDESFRAQSESLSKLERKLNSICNRFEENVINPIYIPTSVIRAKNQYDICDKNDLFASIIYKYYPEQVAHEFIEIWMKKFEIGETFRIDLQKSQYYHIYVKDKDGVEKNLSELGTGSVRLMALLLQIGTILKTKDIYNDPYYQEEIKHLVLIEEPEQNLHPALQSKLADFFESVPNTQFIVETHSEYIIRRSQVLVAKKGYKSIVETNEKSPFVVYYFPDSKDLIPYKMQYQPSGRFLLDFGEGFFDAAANISIELAKIERENRKK